MLFDELLPLLVVLAGQGQLDQLRPLVVVEPVWIDADAALERPAVRIAIRSRASCQFSRVSGKARGRFSKFFTMLLVRLTPGSGV